MKATLSISFKSFDIPSKDLISNIINQAAEGRHHRQAQRPLRGTPARPVGDYRPERNDLRKLESGVGRPMPFRPRRPVGETERPLRPVGNDQRELVIPDRHEGPLRRKRELGWVSGFGAACGVGGRVVSSECFVHSVRLPTTSTLYTVLRSPHIDKKSREQFEKKIHRVTAFIYDDINQINTLVTYLKQHRISGVQLKLTLGYQTRLRAAV